MTKKETNKDFCYCSGRISQKEDGKEYTLCPLRKECERYSKRNMFDRCCWRTAGIYNYATKSCAIFIEKKN